MTVQQELVVIPAQARIDGPVLKTNLVLHEYGLLKVRPVCEKAEVNRGARVKLALNR